MLHRGPQITKMATYDKGEKKRHIAYRGGFVCAVMTVMYLFTFTILTLIWNIDIWNFKCLCFSLYAELFKPTKYNFAASFKVFICVSIQ